MSEESAETDHLKTIVKGGAIVFTGIIVSKIISYLYRIIIARYYGPADYGLFSLGVAIVSFVIIIALLGLPNGIIRYISYYQSRGEAEKTRNIIISSIKMTLPTSVLLIIIVGLLSGYISNGIFSEPMLQPVLIILLVSVPFYVLLSIFIAVFTGFKRIEHKVWSESILSNTIKLVFALIFGILGFGLIGIIWSWTLGIMFGFSLALYYLIKIYKKLPKGNHSHGCGKELLLYSLPLILVTFMSTINAWTDTLMLGFFHSSVEVGIYNAALPTAQILQIFTLALGILFLPVITELFYKNKLKDAQRTYKTVTKWIFYVNFPIFLILVFFSRQILNILFGSEYVIGYISLSILAITYLTVSIYYTSTHVLFSLKKTKLMMYVTFTGTVLNVFLNLVLIPEFNIVGAALATLSTNLLGAVIVIYVSSKSLKSTPFKKGMIKSFASGIISISLIHFLARTLLTEFPIPTMFILFLSFIGLYIILLIAFRGIENEDLEIIKSIARKNKIRSRFIENIVKKIIT
jgi:O-antigen/teichoic acid export membrane protein